MLKAGQVMFLLVPNPSNKRRLAPGKVTVSDASAFAIELEEPFELAAGTETLAFCDVRGKFFQQGVTLVEVQPGVVATYQFERSGEPVSAESRQAFRVSVALSGIVAHVGHRKNCPVVDLSEEGLAIVAEGVLELGSLVKVSIVEGVHTLEGVARVQTVKALPSGKTRYGLLIPKSNSAARKTLQRMTMEFQRVQLKRLAGAA